MSVGSPATPPPLAVSSTNAAVTAALSALRLSIGAIVCSEGEAGNLIDACVCLLLPVSQIVVVVNFNIVEQWGHRRPAVRHQVYAAHWTTRSSCAYVTFHLRAKPLERSCQPVVGIYSSSRATMLLRAASL